MLGFIKMSNKDSQHWLVLSFFDDLKKKEGFCTIKRNESSND